MTPTTSPDKNGEPAKGFTQLSNALADTLQLGMRDKSVLWMLLRRAYGKKTWCNPSQAGIAEQLSIRRETVKAALDSLTAFGLITPQEKAVPANRRRIPCTSTG